MLRQSRALVSRRCKYSIRRISLLVFLQCDSELIDVLCRIDGALAAQMQRYASSISTPMMGIAEQRSTQPTTPPARIAVPSIFALKSAPTLAFVNLFAFRGWVEPGFSRYPSSVSTCLTGTVAYLPNSAPPTLVTSVNPNPTAPAPPDYPRPAFRKSAAHAS